MLHVGTATLSAGKQSITNCTYIASLFQRKAVKSPPLEITKTPMNTGLGNLLWLAVLGQEELDSMISRVPVQP